MIDHERIRRWVEDRGGRPARVRGSEGTLRLQFGEPEELEPISWDAWFEEFERSDLAFEPGSLEPPYRLLGREGSE